MATQLEGNLGKVVLLWVVMCLTKYFSRPSPRKMGRMDFEKVAVSSLSILYDCQSYVLVRFILPKYTNIRENFYLFII